MDTLSVNAGLTSPRQYRRGIERERIMGTGLMKSKKSKRFVALENTAVEKGVRLYKIWGGYQITDNKIDGLNIELDTIDDVESYLKGKLK